MPLYCGWANITYVAREISPWVIVLYTGLDDILFGVAGRVFSEDSMEEEKKEEQEKQQPQDVSKTIIIILVAALVLTLIAVFALAAVYGVFMGAVPGLTATMAVALLVPVTFFLDPISALAATTPDRSRSPSRVPATGTPPVGWARCYRRRKSSTCRMRRCRSMR